MSPYIARVPVADASSLSTSHFGEAVSRAGNTLGGAINQQRRERIAIEQQKVVNRQKDQALDIAEQRAQATLLREQGHFASDAAVKKDALDRLDKLNQERMQGDAEHALRTSLSTPGGALGPFGVFSRAAQASVQAVAEAKQQMAGKVALAQEMTGTAAHGFMTREAADLKRHVLVRGYQEEGQALQHALQDGVFEDPATMFERAASGKTPKEMPPSAGAQQQAKQYAEALQSAIAEGRSPGDVHARLAHQYDIHRQIVQRAKNWPVADTKAAELMDTLRGILAETPSGFDPNTQTDAHAELQQRLAQMDGEWARTQYQTFRMGHEPGDSLAGLQKVLFSASAKFAPDTFMRQDAVVRADQQLPKTNADVVQAAAGANSRASGLDGSAVPRGTPAARKTDTGQRASPDEIAAAEPARAAEREKRGFIGHTRDHNTPKRKMAGEADLKKLRGLVHDEAQKTLSAGGDRKAQVLALRERISKELGLDTSDPRVFSAVKQALSDVYEGSNR